mmetsp:Transcript_90760/g.177593  ORF Transcript_90760/g.177593 Transcript_90760/m.177593 type:complete len:229 (-) Transcript_90760:243-929(-)
MAPRRPSSSTSLGAASFPAAATSTTVGASASRIATTRTARPTPVPNCLMPGSTSATACTTTTTSTTAIGCTLRRSWPSTTRRGKCCGVTRSWPSSATMRTRRGRTPTSRSCDTRIGTSASLGREALRPASREGTRRARARHTTPTTHCTCTATPLRALWVGPTSSRTSAAFWPPWKRTGPTCIGTFGTIPRSTMAPSGLTTWSGSCGSIPRSSAHGSPRHATPFRVSN